MTMALPSGTLTMLFTDIEGSTALLNRLGDRYLDVLTTQRAILRASFDRWHGTEMGTEGDSFFVVFSSVGEAVNAAVQAQRELARCAWPEGASVRVRMGLHTGEPTPHEDGYVGMDVHRAARVASCAHGGQVLLSEATYGIASHQSPSDVSFVDLGRHRLKDLPHPEHLYQLAADGLDRRVAPPRSLGARSSLPVAATSLVGRGGELAELHELVTQAGVRLVTLTGPGGSGKTRLAIDVAAELEGGFADGVYFVPLESVSSADVMWTTVAESLGVTGEGKAPPTFLEYLASRSALVVLDNLEQLPGAAGVVEALLSAAPGLVVLATSRRPLHVAGEYEHGVPPLTLPAPDDDADRVGDSGAAQLFVQRARMVRPDFTLTADNAADVTEICRRLDGLPLAIELAAARVKLLGARALRARLDRSLELTGPQVGRPTRQRTLRAAIEWSYALLPPEQAQAFRQLGVFSGEFDLAAVAGVVGGSADPLDHVGDLVDVNLAAVRDGSDGEPRVRVLQTIGAFARELLAENGELTDARRRHAEHYLALVEAEAPRLRSGQYLSARDRIEGELENLRAALTWSLCADTPDRRPAPDELVIGLRLCESLSWFWYACGYQAEGRDWLGRAVDAAAGRRSRELMNALHGLGVLVLQHGENEQGRDALRTCLEFWRAEGDLEKIARELNSLAIAHRSLAEPDTARDLLTEAIDLARRAGATGRLASALSNLATIESDAGHHDRAIELLHDTLELDHEVGDAWGLGVDRVNLAGVMLRGGRVDEAHEHLRQNAASAVALGDVELSIDVIGLFCAIYAERGEAEPAARLLGTFESMRDKAELPMPAPDRATFEQSVDKVRSLPDPQTWGRNVEIGLGQGVDAALSLCLGPHAEVTSPDR